MTDVVGPGVRALLLVLFGVLVLGFVVFVWNLDPEPGPYTPHYPPTTTTVASNP